jgi:nicotinamide mononucleotide transporter
MDRLLAIWTWANAKTPALQGIEPDANPLEILGVVLGLICVWCYVRESMWSWPTGLVQPLLMAAVFLGAGLYADFGLQVTFAVLQVYGWWRWLAGRDDHARMPITRTAPVHAIALAVLTVAAYVPMAWLIGRYCTGASVPWWDSAVTVLSLAAQWLISHKKLENWLVWIAVDLLSIPLYCYKHLYLTAGLYVVFLVLATLGYLAWRRTIQLPAAAWPTSAPDPHAA